MEGILHFLSERLSDGAIVTSIVSTAVGGGLAHFKPWLLPQEEARKRIGLQRQRLIEGLAASLNEIIERSQGAVPLRGDATHPDLIAQHHSEMFRAISVIRRLDKVHSQIKRAYTFLFSTAGVGLLATLIALLFTQARSSIGLVSIMLILAQFGSVLHIRGQADLLEDYEHTT